MRPWLAWSIFTLLAAVLLSAMGWTSSAVLRLDRVQGDVDRQTELEGRVHLALWRMESVMAPLIAREAARPYFAYGGALPTDPASTETYASRTAMDSLMPWALSSDASPHILLYFQLGPDGMLNSPQLPLLAGAAGPEGSPPQRGDLIQERVTALKAHLDFRQLDTLLSHNDASIVNFEAPYGGAIALADPRDQIYQGSMNEAEYQRRLSMATLNILGPNEGPLAKAIGKLPPPRSQNANASSTLVPAAATSPSTARVTPPTAPAGVSRTLDHEKMAVANAVAALMPRAAATSAGSTSGTLPIYQIGLPKPVWIGDKLLLVRRATIGGKQYFQGCWLDWDMLRAILLRQVVLDLLPAAELAPVKDPDANGRDRMLAALPARLIPGRLGDLYPEPRSPARLSLRLAWAGVVLALGALAALLAGSMALSERRRAFVSSVTHELRTPLTTFRMYTEMLAGGMVLDEQKRARYLATLHAEAGRLTHLVENVLAYARLEAGRPGGRSEVIAVGDLLDRMMPRLAERAQQAQMNLEFVTDHEYMVQVRADLAAVEQILFNLIDNACKYAAAGRERKIRVTSRREGVTMALCVSDYGPGIAPREAKRLFYPFRRSARDIAGNIPGVGLGLALSRRLARAMGGELKLAPPSDGDGACFVLTLPLH